MSPANFLSRVIEPGLALLPSYMVSDEARVLLMATAGQESGLSVRKQAGGPARGYWQFEPAGVSGVSASNGASFLQGVCATLDVRWADVSTAIEYNDPLACVVARLCLWADPAPLPAIGNKSGAWSYYMNAWRPGKPAPSRWDVAYATALSVVRAQ